MAQSAGIDEGPFGTEHPLNWDDSGGFVAALKHMRRSPTLSRLFHPGRAGPVRSEVEQGCEISERHAPPAPQLIGLLSRCSVAFDLAAVYASVSLVSQVLAGEQWGDRPANAAGEFTHEGRVRRGRDAINLLRRSYWGAISGIDPLGYSREDSEAAEIHEWVPTVNSQHRAVAKLTELQGKGERSNWRVAVEDSHLFAQLGFSPSRTQMRGSDTPCIAAYRLPHAVDGPHAQSVRANRMQDGLGCEIRLQIDLYVRQLTEGRCPGRGVAPRSSRPQAALAEEARILLCLLLGTTAASGPATLQEAVMLMDPLIPRSLSLQLCGMDLYAPGRKGLNWSRWRLRNYSRCLALRWVFDAPEIFLSHTSSWPLRLGDES